MTADRPWNSLQVRCWWITMVYFVSLARMSDWEQNIQKMCFLVEIGEMCGKTWSSLGSSSSAPQEWVACSAWDMLVWGAILWVHHLTLGGLGATARKQWVLFTLPRFVNVRNLLRLKMQDFIPLRIGTNFQRRLFLLYFIFILFFKIELNQGCSVREKPI